MRKIVLVFASLLAVVVIGAGVGFAASGGDWSYIFPDKVTDSTTVPAATTGTPVIPLEVAPTTNSSQPTQAATQRTPVPQVVMPIQANYLMPTSSATWHPVDTTIHLDLNAPTSTGWTPPTVVVPPVNDCHAAEYVCDIYGH